MTSKNLQLALTSARIEDVKIETNIYNCERCQYRSNRAANLIRHLQSDNHEGICRWRLKQTKGVFTITKMTPLSLTNIIVEEAQLQDVQDDIHVRSPDVPPSLFFS